MKSVTTHEAKTHLSALLRDVSKGVEVEIRRGDRAIARLVPAERGERRRRPPVGTVTSPPVRYDHDAFEALDESGMEKLGLL